MRKTAKAFHIAVLGGMRRTSAAGRKSISQPNKKFKAVRRIQPLRRRLIFYCFLSLSCLTQLDIILYPSIKLGSHEIKQKQLLFGRKASYSLTKGYYLFRLLVRETQRF